MNEQDHTAAWLLLTELEEIRDFLCDLRGEWQWKKDEPRRGYREEYRVLEAQIARLTEILK